jgi:predicted ATPase/DNA-binding NarL/FixJ family response regulator
MEIPAAASTLYGRSDELEQITEHLNDPDHRLVSLIGPGGIGKTSLALEAARRYGDRTKDGAIFIDLQAIDQHELVIQRLADALQISIQNNETALAQITQFLQGKETLLYFDNFEQVIEAAPIIADLLIESPGTTALVTSRTPLRLTQEWILQVDGLSIPQTDALNNSTNNAATQLFVDRAIKVRPDLQIEQNLPHIEKICKIVEGMPLAIEIAASWAHLLECSEIAQELQKDHALLESNMRDVPERHRSIDAIFNQSMNMLSEAEISVFEKLSIFRGGFTRDAAITVAGSNLPTLSSLTDRSLIRVAGNGRYRIHELVRQFGADQLAQNESHLSAVQNLHCNYYMEFLAKRHVTLTVKNQVETAHEIEAESENLRTAWQYAIDNTLAPQIASAATPYGQFIQYRGRYAVAGQTFSQAVKTFSAQTENPENQKTLALLLIEHGRFSLRQGNLDEAQTAYSESEKLHKSLKMKPQYGLLMDPQLGYAYLESTRGNIQQAVTHTEQVLERAHQESHQLHIAMANQLLGHLALRQGKLEEARKHDRAALASCAEQGERWFVAYCHNELGELEIAEGNYTAATDHFTQSLNISSEFQDRANIGLAQVCLGEVATLAAKYDDAAQLFEDSKIAYDQLGDRGGSARVQSGLGTLAVATGKHGAAYHHLKGVLETATEMQFPAMTLDALEGIGELALKTQYQNEGEKLLKFVAAHESTDSRTRARLKAASNQADKTQSSPGSIDDHVTIAKNFLTQIHNELKEEITASLPQQQSTGTTQNLPEPLTEREIEILERIADGLPNQQIGDELFISLGTVKWYNNQIYTKLGVHNRTSAVVKARNLNIISPA